MLWAEACRQITGLSTLTMTVKLYDLLFAESTNTLDVDSLAMCDRKNYRSTYILYDLNKLKQLVEEWKQDEEFEFDNHMLKDVVVAWMVVRAPKKDKVGICSGAWNVAYEVRNPAYKGAGKLLTGLISSYLGVALTGDRDSSNSVSARNKWDAIQKDATFTKVPLDNYVNWNYDGESTTPIYVHHDGSELVKNEPEGPTTPNDPSDDCKHPGDTVGQATEIWGTDAAFKKTGQSATPFIERHKEATKIMEDVFGITPADFDDALYDMGSEWFDQEFTS